MKKRFLSLLAGALLLLGCVQQVAATDISSVTEAELPAETVMYDESSERIGGFSRNYTVYLSSGTPVDVMDDDNWDIYNKTNVSVTFKSTEGPSQIYVMIYYKEDGASNWSFGTASYLTVADSTSISIPSGNAFKVTTTLVDGKKGNVTLNVTLS